MEPPSPTRASEHPRPTSTTNLLVDLAQLIQSSVATIEWVCWERDIAFPSMDDPFSPDSEAFRASDEANTAANTIAAAAFQLIAAVMPPAASVLTLISGVNEAAAMRVCVEANVTEILREAGPQGLHINDIAKKAKLPATQLGRLIRHLATRHVYKELTPDVYTNNRLSSVLDTGKSVESCQADPAAKHDDTDGFPAYMAMLTDEPTKAAAYTWETLSDPANADSGDMIVTSFNHAFNTELPFWHWLQKPEQARRLRRFGPAMRGALAGTDTKALILGDVGSGVGTLSLILAEEHENLNFVLQDTLPTIEQAKKVWAAESPNVFESGRVRFEEHDFFLEQPVTNASVFVLGHILHDWPDAYAAKILTHLRNATRPDTRLILLDSVIPCACRVRADDPETESIVGAIPREAPEPLLANYGAANAMGSALGLYMVAMFNSGERTVKELLTLLKMSGWKLTEVVRSEGVSNFRHPAIAVPIVETDEC